MNPHSYNKRLGKRFPTIVCLCGSTRFMREFIDANKRETLDGKIVLSVGFFCHHEGEKSAITDREKESLDELHKRKIDLSDEILVLNVGGYIGDSTKSEIEYAVKCGVKVRYLEDVSGQVKWWKDNTESTDSNV